MLIPRQGIMAARDKGAQLEIAVQNGRDAVSRACQYPGNQSARTSDEARLPGRGLHNVGVSGGAFPMA